MTIEEFADVVSGSVVGPLSERLDELESRLDTVAGRAQLDGLSERLDALSNAAVTREDLQELLGWCREAFAAALFLLYGRPAPPESRDLARYLAENLDKRRIVAALDMMTAYYRDCYTAVGVGHVLGALAADLESL